MTNAKNLSRTTKMKDAIITDIETKVQFCPHTHKDFIRLSILIEEKAQHAISASTLKRVWGHSQKHNAPSLHTLNILSNFLNFADYRQYCKHKEGIHARSFINILQTCDLTRGDELELSWLPNRHLMLRYMGDKLFRVVASENGSLNVGDTVSTLYFVEGEAITFTQISSSGTSPVVYIAGKISGIHFSPINSDLEFTSPLPLIVD